MQFSNPIFLWTLAGLSIPIAIHLLSKKEGKIIRLGSLRHLQETSTQQFRGIRLNEMLLLALRCLLIVLLSLLLSGLHWKSSGTNRWVLIEKGLENRPTLITAVDSLSTQGYEPRWLSANFPQLKDSSNLIPLKNYREIIGELEILNQSEIIVFALNRPSGFTGTRTSIPSSIRWISQPANPKTFQLQSIRVSNDSAFVRTGHTDENETYFTNEKINGTRLLNTVEIEELNISIVSDEKYEYDKRIIKAVLTAVKQSFPVRINLIEIGPGQRSDINADWIIWFSDQKIPATPSRILYLRPNASDELITQATSREWIITIRLTEEIALKNNLTLAIASLVLPGRASLEELASSNDRRMMPDSIVWSPFNSNFETSQATFIPEPGDRYLLVLFLVVLLAERIISYNRNQ